MIAFRAIMGTGMLQGLTCSRTEFIRYVTVVMASPLLAQHARRQPRPHSPVGLLPEWDGGKSQFDDQYVFFDSSTDEYVVRYPENLNDGAHDSKRMIVFRFRPEYLVEPSVRVHLSSSASGGFVYRYTVANALTAPDSIRTFKVVVPSHDATIQLFHPNWVYAGVHAISMRVAPQAALFSGTDLEKPANRGRFVLWMSSTRGTPIGPGTQESGFRIQSLLLPGITTAYFSTLKILRTPSEMPQRVVDQLTPLVAPENNYKSAPTIGPMYDLQRSKPLTLLDIARDYRANIIRLVSLRYLQDGSLYVREVLKWLDGFLSGPDSRSRRVDAAPETPFEQEIDEAMKIALNSR